MIKRGVFSLLSCVKYGAKAVGIEQSIDHDNKAWAGTGVREDIQYIVEHLEFLELD